MGKYHRFPLILLLAVFACGTGVIFLQTAIYNSVPIFSTKSYAADDSHGDGGGVGSGGRLVINSTLGFEKVLYANLPYRYDRGDIMAMQATVCDLDFTRTDAVTVDQIKDQGLPPISNPKRVSLTERACFRSHANIWRKMLEERWSTVLIMEDDATWDMNIKDIMSHFSSGLYQLMQTLNISSSLSGPPTAQDPYLSKHWDVLQLAGSFQSSEFLNSSLLYDDPHVVPGADLFGQPLPENKRVVRLHGATLSAGAYALSRRGALKLLLRSAIDLDRPVDWFLTEMVDNGNLEVYSVSPVIFPQYVYLEGLDIDSKNSDNRDTDSTHASNVTELWDKVHDTMNVWQLHSLFKTSQLKEPVLPNLKNLIYHRHE